jgi:DNA-binding NtrC family response regulator
MRVRKPRVLVVDRDGETARGLVAALRREPLQISWARDDESARNRIETEGVDALVAALRAPRVDGLALMRRALARRPETCVVILAEARDLDRAVAAMREGASDFQIGPVMVEKLLAVLERGFARQAEAAALGEARTRLDRQFGLARLAGPSPAMHRLREQVAQVASTRTPVLIEGESGSGKRLIAQVIHQAGARRDGPFVWVGCDALAQEEAEGELFGAEDAARGDRPGRFERADGGTLFLDEVTALPATAQAALLRALHDRSYAPVGARESRRADVRLIAATGRDLAGEVRGGRFRADLAERLAVVRIRVPALRERREDLPALVEYLMAEVNREQGRRVRGVTRGALERLASHEWPGNVRELRQALEAMVATAEGKGPLGVSDLPAELRGPRGRRESVEASVGMTVGEVEGRLIAATLSHVGGDKRRAAALLGIGLRTLYRKIREHGLG